MKNRKWRTALLLATSTLLCGGCSRSTLNYQIAECIGTLDQYENNEPVETPKMKAEREQRESESEVEAQRAVVLEQAAVLAKEYRYDEAVSLLQNSELTADNETAKEQIAQYQSAANSMYAYDGDIGHLSFTNLVVDPETAFYSSENAQVYRDTMLTLNEFQAILDELYKAGYILIDVHSLAQESASGNSVTMTGKNPLVPQGKKPFILSIDNLNYADCQGVGVPTRLTVDANGEVAAVYTDSEGHELTGAYDVIPVLEAFIKEHPDFSFQGARGIISVSGEHGVFGYQIEEGSSPNYEENRAAAADIAECLKEQGWTFASAGYSYQYMKDLSYESLKEDFTKWETTAGAVVGPCDTLIYPYGSEVDYSTEKGAFVVNRGFRYLIGMWAEGDHREVNQTYLRQTRRAVTGYILENYPNNFDAFFLTSAVRDAAR